MTEPMSNDKSQELTEAPATHPSKVPWGPLSAVGLVAALYVAVQFLGGLLVTEYGVHVKHLTHSQLQTWLTESITAQFFYVLLIEVATVACLVWFIRHRKGRLAQIGLTRPKLIDLGYACVGFVSYFVVYIASIKLVELFLPQIDLQQQQDVGFQNVAGGGALILTFISLVILPPIAEEIIFRGFLYTGLRRSLPVVAAAILTSIIFASAHLLESSDGSLLWIAGIDTFVLSMVLVWLREKTGRLYAGMILHGLKNGIAFLVLYHIALGLGS
jgi:membrane protease YdiL (CAAX protease family)